MVRNNAILGFGIKREIVRFKLGHRELLENDDPSTIKHHLYKFLVWKGYVKVLLRDVNRWTEKHNWILGPNMDPTGLQGRKVVRQVRKEMANPVLATTRKKNNNKNKNYRSPSREDSQFGTCWCEDELDEDSGVCEAVQPSKRSSGEPTAKAPISQFFNVDQVESALQDNLQYHDYQSNLTNESTRPTPQPPSPIRHFSGDTTRGETQPVQTPEPEKDQHPQDIKPEGLSFAQTVRVRQLLRNLNNVQNVVLDMEGNRLYRRNPSLPTTFLKLFQSSLDEIQSVINGPDEGGLYCFTSGRFYQQYLRERRAAMMRKIACKEELIN